MPVKQSAFKALRQSKKRQVRNVQIKMDLKTAIKKTRKLMAEEPTSAQLTDMIISIIKQTDKAAQKSIIKKNKAAHIKSRLLRDLDPSIKQSLFVKKEKASA